MSPIAVFVSQLEDEDELKLAIKIDTNHTHSRSIIVDCNITLAICCRELLRGKGAAAAYKAAKDFALKSRVKDWFLEIEANEMQQVNKRIGWVKIAFQRALYYLKEDFSYEKALKDILLRGGDTDTNAAIVGMVLGARDGLSKLDQDAVKKVLKWSNSKGGHKRPDFLIPKYSFYENFDKMFMAIPKKLEVVYGI